jgi:hypothetical protein
LSVLVSWNVVTTLWAVWLLYWILSAWGVGRDERAESTGNRFLTTLILGCGASLIFARNPRLRILDERFVPAADGIRAPAPGSDRGWPGDFRLGEASYRAILECARHP